MSKSQVSKNVWSRWMPLVVAAGLAACADDSVAPTPEATPPAEPPRVVGFAELTFSDIGTPQLSSSLLVAPTLEALEELRAERYRSGDPGDRIAHDLTPPANGDRSGDGTIQLRLNNHSEFVLDSIRYLHAAYDVRNAQLDSTVYDTERTNLTFFGVSTNSTINQTAVRRLLLPGGRPAPAQLALEVLPTGLLQTNDTILTAVHPDVLQILREAEVAAVPAPAGVTTMFPYGFVVRRVGSTTTRTLPASPQPDDFAGIIDFAFQIPQQGENDPQTLSVLMLAVDDSETRVAQGHREQTSAGTAAAEQVAEALGATTLTLLPPAGGATLGGNERVICEVRTAGPADGATATMFPTSNAGWLLPTPFHPGPLVLDTANLGLAAAGCPSLSGPSDVTFPVFGNQGGQRFVGGAYTGDGSSIIRTPTGSFFAGEQIDVTLTTTLGVDSAIVGQYRTRSAPASGQFTQASGSPIPIQARPAAVVAGDFNSNGQIDLATANIASNNVWILMNDGNGTGTFSVQDSVSVGDSPNALVAGDWDGNGSLDLATANSDGNSVSILTNDGSANFSVTGTVNIPGGTPNHIAAGDVDEDGDLDLVTGNSATFTLSILQNDGSGAFSHFQDEPTGFPSGVAVADLNQDGKLELIASRTPAAIRIFLSFGNAAYFPSEPPLQTGDIPNGVAVGDFDGDGDHDLAVTTAANEVRTFFNVSTPGFELANFTPGGSVPVGDIPQAVITADLDGDGDLDLANVNFNGPASTVSILRNDGSGTFTPSGTPSVGTNPSGLVAADLDGDGDLDLAVAASGSRNLTILLNDEAAPMTASIEQVSGHDSVP